MQRISARIAAHRVPRAHIGGDLALERLALGSEHVAARREHAAHCCVDIVLEQAVLASRVHHGDGSRGAHPNLCRRSRTSLPTSSARPSALRPSSPFTAGAAPCWIACTKLSAWQASASPPAWLSSCSSIF